MEKTEEKLYFRPEVAENKKANKKGTKRDKRFVKALIFLFSILIIDFIIFWFLRGSTKTTGQYPENVRNESLVCENPNIVYEKVNKINSDNKNLKISMIFLDEKTLSTANLEYKLVFSDYQEAYSAEAISHSQFNLDLQKLGYKSGNFNNKFSILDNELLISLNLSSRTSLDETTQSYFLINNKNNGGFPETLEEYKHNYEDQGFSCVSTSKQ